MPENEWRTDPDSSIWRLKAPDGRTLMQINWDYGLAEYVLTKDRTRLGKSWDEARRAAERLAEPSIAPAPRKKGRQK